jgi:hypothetical protein
MVTLGVEGDKGAFAVIAVVVAVVAVAAVAEEEVGVFGSLVCFVDGSIVVVVAVGAVAEKEFDEGDIDVVGVEAG